MLTHLLLKTLLSQLSPGACYLPLTRGSSSLAGTAGADTAPLPHRATRATEHSSNARMLTGVTARYHRWAGPGGKERKDLIETHGLVLV